MIYENKRPVIIWGAGRIGRGFIAEAFDAPYHQLVLVDVVKPLVDKLSQRGRYTIHHADASGIHDSIITGYRAFETGDRLGLMPYFLGQSPIVSVTGFASKVNELAQMLSTYVRERAQKTPGDPMDFVLSINMMRPEEAFREALTEALSNDKTALDYLNTQVGIVPSVVMCITPATPDIYCARDPLAIYNNNFPELIVGKQGLKGRLPEGLPKLRLSDDIDAEETRKIYSLNMVHATASYLSMGSGMEYVIDAIKDPSLKKLLETALDESAIGLMGEFGFSGDEMTEWNRRMISLLENPYISDDLVRLGSDTRRKLGHDDRLVGSALLSMKHGGNPTTIAHAIRRGFDYQGDDEGTLWVQQIVRDEGLIEALRRVSGIEEGTPLYDMVMEPAGEA